MAIDKVGDYTVNTQLSNIKNNGTESSDFEKRLKNAMDNKDEKELKKVCQDFEAIIMGMMYKQMRASVPKNQILPKEQGREIFEGMLDDKLVEEASKRGSFGLANTLYKQLGAQLKATYKPGSL